MHGEVKDDLKIFIRNTQKLTLMGVKLTKDIAVN